MTGMHGYKVDLAPVCAFTMMIGRRQVIGDMADARYQTGAIDSGMVSGPRIRGKVLPGAVDWAQVLADGILEPEVKLVIETDDGALIHVSYVGVVDMGSEAYEKTKRGEAVGTVFHPRTVLRMKSSAPAYLWVNRRQFIGIGFLDYKQASPSINYDIYELAVPAPGAE
jgi:hypothetical protein